MSPPAVTSNGNSGANSGLGGQQPGQYSGQQGGQFAAQQGFGGQQGNQFGGQQGGQYGGQQGGQFGGQQGSQHGQGGQYGAQQPAGLTQNCAFAECCHKHGSSTIAASRHPDCVPVLHIEAME